MNEKTKTRSRIRIAFLASSASLVVAGALAGAVAGALTSACVTVNVNFPESAVQKAADDYVRELYRAKERGKNPSPSPSPATTSTASWSRSSWSLVPEARADEPVFRVDSAKALKIRDRLAAKLDDVLAQKRAGLLGETRDGMLAAHGAEKLKPLLKKRVDALVEDENSARKELYAEVLETNRLPKNRLIDIQKSFARSFQAESPAGTWIEDTSGKWSQK